MKASEVLADVLVDFPEVLAIISESEAAAASLPESPSASDYVKAFGGVEVHVAALFDKVLAQVKAAKASA